MLAGLMDTEPTKTRPRTIFAVMAGGFVLTVSILRCCCAGIQGRRRLLCTCSSPFRLHGTLPLEHPWRMFHSCLERWRRCCVRCVRVGACRMARMCLMHEGAA